MAICIFVHEIVAMLTSLFVENYFYSHELDHRIEDDWKIPEYERFGYLF